jgi:hypothetical protein
VGFGERQHQIPHLLGQERHRESLVQDTQLAWRTREKKKEKKERKKAKTAN